MQLQSGCEAGFAAGKTSTSCASICVISVLSHGFRTIKYTVIQFRSKAENTEKKWKDEGAGLFREQDR